MKSSCGQSKTHQKRVSCMTCWVKCFMSPWDIVCGMFPSWKKQTGNVMSWTVCLSLSKLTNKIPSRSVRPVSSSARLPTFARGDTWRPSQPPRWAAMLCGLHLNSCQGPSGVKPLVPCFAFLFTRRCCPALINYLVETWDLSRCISGNLDLKSQQYRCLARSNAWVTRWNAQM